ncbi:MAG TPA: Gar1/Naf1 family protein [Thermoplasmata archaeon]|nr:Gar1/Naf1 family protein [Thermoplasmata archaeon]
MSREGRRAGSRVREAGTLLAVTPSGWLIARCAGAEFPSEGRTVRDRSGRPVGRVGRVFGPVKQPYLAIRPPRPPTVAEAAALLGTTLVE